MGERNVTPLMDLQREKRKKKTLRNILLNRLREKFHLVNNQNADMG